MTFTMDQFLGQLGYGEKGPKEQLVPKHVLFFMAKRVKHVACGGKHTIVITGNMLPSLLSSAVN